MTSCGAVVATKFDREVGNSNDGSKTGDKGVRFKCCIDQLRCQIDGDSVDIVSSIGGDLDSRDLGLTLPDLCKVCVTAEEVVVSGLAERDVEMVECLLPGGFCD